MFHYGGLNEGTTPIVGPIKSKEVEFPDIPATPVTDDYLSDDNSPKPQADTNFWNMWNGTGGRVQRWTSVPQDVRAQIYSAISAGNISDQGAWAGLQARLDELNATYLMGDTAGAEAMRLDLLQYIATNWPTTTETGGGAGTGGVPRGINMTEEQWNALPDAAKNFLRLNPDPTQHPDGVLGWNRNLDAAMGIQPETPEAPAQRPPLNLDFLDAIDLGPLSAIFPYVSGGKLSGGKVGKEFADWYNASTNISPDAARLSAEGLFRQIANAAADNDTERLLDLAGVIGRVSPTMGQWIESYVGGPGTGFSDTFNYQRHQWAVNPDTGDVRVWNPESGQWQSYNSNAAAPGVVDYYIQNIYKGPVETGPVEDFIEGVGLPNEEGIYEFTVSMPGVSRGNRTAWYNRGQAEMPKFSWDPETKKMTYVSGYTGPGSFAQGVVAILQSRGWKITSRDGKFADWEWAPPSEPYKKQTETITVEGPETQERVGLKGRTSA
jgi:hypothetical protein